MYTSRIILLIYVYSLLSFYLFDIHFCQNTKQWHCHFFSCNHDKHHQQERKTSEQLKTVSYIDAIPCCKNEKLDNKFFYDNRIWRIVLSVVTTKKSFLKDLNLPNIPVHSCGKFIFSSKHKSFLEFSVLRL